MSNIRVFDFYKKNKESNNANKVNNEPERIVKLSREQIYNNLFEYIAPFKKMHGENLEFKISSQEWRLFFDVFYKHFLESGIIQNYQEAMEFVLQSVLSFPLDYQKDGLTLKSLVENIDMPFMFLKVPDKVLIGIKEELNDAVSRIKIVGKEDNHISGK